MSYLLEWLLPKNTRVIKCWWKCEEKGDLCTAGGNVNWFSHYGQQYDDSSKVKNRTSMWSSNSTSGYFLKENKNTNFKSYICIPMLIAALFAVAKTWKHKCLSMDEWIRKNQILFSHEKMKSCRFWLHGWASMLNEMSDKDKYHIISLICGLL